MKTLLFIAILWVAAAAELPSRGYGLPSASASSNVGTFGSFNGGSAGRFNGGSSGGFTEGIGFGTNGGSRGSFNGGVNGNRNGGYGYGPSQEELDLLVLASNVPGGGVVGQDYSVLSEVPETGFACEDTGYQFGYFADTDDAAGCQVFHVCQSRAAGFQKDSFLCPNGTLFSQEYLVCDWWYNVDCSQSVEFYSVNELIGVEPDALAAASSLSSRYRTPDQGNGNGRNGFGRGVTGTGIRRNGSSKSKGSANRRNGFNGSGRPGNGFFGTGLTTSASASIYAYGSNDQVNGNRFGSGNRFSSTNLNGSNRNGNGLNGNRLVGSASALSSSFGGPNASNGNGYTYADNGGRRGNGLSVNGINGNGRDGNELGRQFDSVAAPSSSYGVPS